MSTFYERHDAMELAPYCAFFDCIQSEALGLGMENPHCLGRGDARCVEQMKRGRSTDFPEPVAAIICRVTGRREP